MRCAVHALSCTLGGPRRWHFTLPGLPDAQDRLWAGCELHKRSYSNAYLQSLPALCLCRVAPRCGALVQHLQAARAPLSTSR